jgi:hypothetical protein
MARPTSKVCPICSKNKKFSDYYVHRRFDKEYGCDPICKVCSKAMAISKEGLANYCSTTSRPFLEELWNWCEDKVTTIFNKDDAFNSLTEIQQKKKFTQRMINTYFGQMGQAQWYSYTGAELSGEVDEIEATEVEVDDSADAVRSDKKKYSLMWGGDFTEEELIYLNMQYKKAQEDYDLKTTNDLEYAMNVAVAGLIVRKARSSYLNEEAGSDKRWREAVSSYDSLCTSAKFNQKTRTENSNTGLGSFGETWKRLEEMGFKPVLVNFPKDDVDKILEEYAHSHVALRGALDDVE